MKAKVWAVLILLLLVVIFTIQNYASVSLKLLFWSINTSLAILVFITLVVGIIIGMLIKKKG